MITYLLNGNVTCWWHLRKRLKTLRTNQPANICAICEILLLA